MNPVFIQYYTSPFGELIVGSYKDELCLLDWRFRKMRDRIDRRIQNGLNAEYKEGPSAVIAETIVQIEEYSRSERTNFEIPLRLVGTDFQNSVWEALQKIEFGKTISYLELAKNVNAESSATDAPPVLERSLPIRAVAGANGANAIGVIVPCHRVIGSDGQLVGYAGGLSTKKKLLQIEHIFDKQIDLFL